MCAKKGPDEISIVGPRMATVFISVSFAEMKNKPVDLLKQRSPLLCEAHHHGSPVFLAEVSRNQLCPFKAV